MEDPGTALVTEGVQDEEPRFSENRVSFLSLKLQKQSLDLSQYESFKIRYKD